MVNQIKNGWNKLIKTPIEYLYLIFSLTFGFIFVFMIPPHQQPDEHSHFYRAYHISEGAIQPGGKDGRLGGEVATSVVTTTEDIMAKLRTSRGTYSDLNFRELLSQDLNKDEKIFIRTSAAQYSPTAYIPQISAILMAKLFNFPPIVMFYFVRLITLFASTFIIFKAIKLLPSFKPLFMLIALMPMSIAQISSSSADSQVLAFSFFTVAMFLKLYFIDKKVTRNDLILIVLATTAVLMAKTGGLIPIALLFLFVPTKRFKDLKHRLGFIGLTIGVPILASILWYLFTAQELAGANAANMTLSGIAKDILLNPSNIILLHVRDLLNSGIYYFDQFLGRLGWLDAPLFFAIHLLPYFILMMIFTLTEEVKTKLYSRFLPFQLIAIAVVNYLLLGLILYIVWVKFGGGGGTGLQGRYFIPFAAIIFIGFKLLLQDKFGLSGLKFESLNKERSFLIMGVMYSMLMTMVAVFMRYFDIHF